MVRAAVGGVIDYGKADPLNRFWRLHEHLLLDELLHQEHLDYLTHKLNRHLALLAAPLTEESVKTHLQSEYQTLLDYHDTLLYRPLESEDERKEREGRELESAWEQNFGSLNDPAVQQSITAVADWMRSRREAGR